MGVRFAARVALGALAILLAFSDSALEFALRCVVADFDRSLIVKSDLYFAILERLRAAGIRMPAPQREVPARRGRGAGAGEIGVNYLERLMTRRGLIGCGLRAGAVVAAAALAGCSGFGDREPPSGQPSFYRSMAQPGAELDTVAAQSMISGYRQNNGLTAVTLDPTLTRLAQEQAKVMAARDKLDHSAGRPFQDRIRTSGFDARVAAENISAGYHTLAEAFSGWRDSSQHRANMLLNGATRMGIAAVYAPNSKYKVFWSLILAAPDDKRT